MASAGHGCCSAPLRSRTSLSDSCSYSSASCASKSYCEEECEEDFSCRCYGEPREEEPKQLISEIASKGEPYKEIEAIVNDSRVVVRVQTERPKPEFDPPCDCLEPPPEDDRSIRPESSARRSGRIVLQKASEGCRTVSVYPHPDPRATEPTRSDTFASRADSKKAAKEPIRLPPVNPEENPNVFLLRIRRECESHDRRHKIDLEFRLPRAWRKSKCCKRLKI